MAPEAWNETLVEQLVTYVVEVNGTIVVITNVPARVNVETGERLFSPETVAKIQEIIRSKKAPVKVLQTPVFEFAA